MLLLVNVDEKCPYKRLIVVMFVKVLLHDPKDQPLMLERGFKVSPGFVTQVSITPTYVSNNYSSALLGTKIILK